MLRDFSFSIPSVVVFRVGCSGELQSGKFIKTTLPILPNRNPKRRCSSRKRRIKMETNFEVRSHNCVPQHVPQLLTQSEGKVEIMIVSLMNKVV